MSEIEFSAWPKTPRLFRPVTITEKLDGTNAAVIITKDGEIGAQSRKRLITPADDNYGFASWVWEHAAELRNVLGPGRHFGEWWGSGIQRGYGLQNGDKRFSLFNVKKWADTIGVFYDWTPVPGLRTVPVLYEDYTFDTRIIVGQLNRLRREGSHAVEGFDQPEGIVVYHHAGNHIYKALLDNDDIPKGVLEEMADIDTDEVTARRRMREAMEERAQYA